LIPSLEFALLGLAAYIVVVKANMYVDCDRADQLRGFAVASHASN
jgi:hypothetical protein